MEWESCWLSNTFLLT